MKKYLIIALMLLIVTATKAQQIEGTQITSPIVPNDILDNYPTHIDSLGFGGYRVVADTNQRNAIKSTRKTKGMLVYALSDSTLYKLEDIGSNKWSVLTTRLSDIDTIPNNLVIKGSLDVIGNPPFNYPEILLSIRDSAENQRMLVSKNGLFLAGRLHTGPIDVDGLYMLGAKNYLGGMNSSASGYNAYNNSDTTQAFGNYLHTGDKNNSILIGTGKSEAEPLLLDRHNSVQIGANSTTPNIILTEDTTVIDGLFIVDDTAQINVLEIADSSAKAIISNNDTLATTPWVRTYVDDNSGSSDLQEVLTNTDYSGYPNNRATGIIRIYNNSNYEPQYIKSERGGFGSGYDSYVSGVEISDATDVSLVTDYTDTGIDRTSKVYAGTNAGMQVTDNLASTYSRFSITSNQMLIRDNMNNRGLENYADYSANSTARSLVDSAQVASMISSGGSIGGNNNEILMSDGSGGTKTDIDFNWDGKTFLIQESNTTRNIYIGSSSGGLNTGGVNNTQFGYGTGQNNIDGDRNTFIGANAGAAYVGSANIDDNTYIGYRAGYTSFGNRNVAIGSQAGYNNISTGCVFIGYQSGYSETGSNKLYIENSNSTSPLIYGDFDNTIVKINGTQIMSTDTIPDNDATPDVSAKNAWTYNGTANAVTVTDLDNPNAGAIYRIIGNSDTYTITINDSGNFNLSGNWTGGIDDVLTIFVQADNDYIEISRSDN